MSYKQKKNIKKKYGADKDSAPDTDFVLGEDIKKEPLLDISFKTFICIFILIGICAVLTVILFYLGILEKVKPFILSHYDTLNCFRYSQGSTDIFTILFSLLIVSGFAFIHPIFGVCAISFIRCWLDGYTYPTDNTYFVWAIVIITFSYILRIWFKYKSIKVNIQVLLFSIFILILYSLLPISEQYGKSYRITVLWISYALLFFSSYGSLTTFRYKNILLWALIIIMGLQAWYAFMHFQYVLPFLRKSLAEDPALRIRFFGTAELSKELIYRFNVNRAFGTMLFPNALGGFIILLIPISIYWMYYHIKSFLRLWQIKNPSMTKSMERWVLIQTAIIWLISTVLIYATELFPLTYSIESSSNIDIYLAGGVSALLSLIPSCLFAWICIKKGHQTGKYFLYTLITFTASLFGLLSLWLTYSRGSWLSLTLSILSVCFLILLSRVLRIKDVSPYLTNFLLLLVVILLFIFIISIEKSSAEEANNPTKQENEDISYQKNDAIKAGEEILESGVGVSFRQLRDPSSFRLRWSYWKVGFNMWLHNFFTGIGLGNFALAYPRYQYLGAGDVKECHNGYLQMLCETGILGGGVFIVFIFSVVYKIGKLLWDKSLEPKNVALSIGILAFLIHAGLDIHFSHPSLITYFLITLSLFLSDIPLKMNKDVFLIGKTSITKFLTLILLFVSCYLIYLSYPPYFRDLVRSRMSFINAGKDTEISTILKTINYTFNDVFQYALGQSNKQPKMSATILKYFFLDLNNIRNFGSVYVPEKKGSNRAVLLPEGEPVPANAVLVVKNSWGLITRVRNVSLKYAEYLKQVDNIFPYQEDITSSLCEIYKQVFSSTTSQYHPDIIEKSRSEMLFWAEETVRRNPYHGDLYYNLGKVQWLAGLKDCEDFQKQKEFLKKAIDNFEVSASIWKNVPFYWDEYIVHMKYARDLFEKSNLTEEVSALEERIKKADKYVTELKEKRRKLNIW